MTYGEIEKNRGRISDSETRNLFDIAIFLGEELEFLMDFLCKSLWYERRDF